MNPELFVDKYQKRKEEQCFPILKDIMIIPNFLSCDECNDLVKLFENNIDNVEKMSTRERLSFDSTELAQWLWNILSPQYSFPNVKDNYGDIWSSYGLNEHFRLVKYNPGDKLDVHEDGFYELAYNKRSFATVLIYLNTVDQENGGSTDFIRHSVKIQPTKGLGLVFLVDGIEHMGSSLISGKKYIIRTDVMYEAINLKNKDLKKKLHSAKKAAEIADGVDDAECNKLWSIYFQLLDMYRQN